MQALKIKPREWPDEQRIVGAKVPLQSSQVGKQLEGEIHVDTTINMVLLGIPGTELQQLGGIPAQTIPEADLRGQRHVLLIGMVRVAYNCPARGPEKALVLAGLEKGVFG